MPQMLEDLEISEVSLVDRPACAEDGVPRARIALFKRDGKTTDKGDSPRMTLEQIEKKLTEQEGVITTLRNENNVLKAERDIAKAEEDMVVKMNQAERRLYASMTPERRQEFQKADSTKRKAMMEDEEKDEKEKAAKDLMTEAQKAEFEKAGPARRAQMVTEAEKAVSRKDPNDVLAKRDCPTCDGTGEVDGEDCPDCEGTGEMDNSDDTDKKDKKDKTEKRDNAELVELRKRDAESRDRLSKAEASLERITKKERLLVFVAKAERELPNTPGTPEEKGERLMKMADGCGGDSSSMFLENFETLKAADKALGANFHEVGKGGATVPAGKIFDAKVTEIAKRDKISVSKATAAVMEEFPELYREYEHEQRMAVSRY